MRQRNPSFGMCGALDHIPVIRLKWMCLGNLCLKGRSLERPFILAEDYVFVRCLTRKGHGFSVQIAVLSNVAKATHRA